MTEGTDNLVLEHLRAIRALQARSDERLDEVLMRLRAIEQHVAAMHTSDVQGQIDIDRIKERLDRIEQRLELRDA